MNLLKLLETKNFKEKAKIDSKSVFNFIEKNKTLVKINFFQRLKHDLCLTSYYIYLLHIHLKTKKNKFNPKK